MNHEFTVKAPGIALCSRCARPDLVSVRRLPCVPRRDAAEVVERKLRWVKVVHDMLEVGPRKHSYPVHRRKAKARK